MLSIFDIQADHDLNIMQDQQTLAALRRMRLLNLIASLMRTAGYDFSTW